MLPDNMIAGTCNAGGSEMVATSLVCMLGGWEKFMVPKGDYFSTENNLHECTMIL